MISRPLPPIGFESTNRENRDGQYLPVRLAKGPESPRERWLIEYGSLRRKKKDKAALPRSTVVEAIGDTADPSTRARYTLQSTVQSTVVEAIGDMPGLSVVLKAATRDESTVVEKGQEMEVLSWWPKQSSNNRPQIPTNVDPALRQPLPDSDLKLARELVTAGWLSGGPFITTVVNLVDAYAPHVKSSEQHQAAPSEVSSHQGETAPAVTIYLGGGTTSRAQTNDTDLHCGLKKAYEEHLHHFAVEGNRTHLKALRAAVEKCKSK